VTIHYRDDWLTVMLGDCREVMASMEPESVHCVVTSPPYWGLRDYGTATWLGGDEACDHETPRSRGADIKPGDKQGTSAGSRPNTQRECRCGATRQDSQLGLEPTPEAYVESMVAVFREVRRVLRSDGTVWLNLGDSYNGSGGIGGNGKQHTNGGSVTRPDNRAGWAGLKPKDLVGIPWRVAFALQADGWYLRSDIIWSKPNPMPESVTDRPTKSHEYLFLLSKSPRYYFDNDAIREDYKADALWRYQYGFNPGTPANSATKNPAVGRERSEPNPAGRNIRSVWTIATQPYPGAHFATFPQALVEPCIKAGTSERGVCPECGAPWERDATWRPSCRCGMPGHIDKPHQPVPATVLDCFAGSGTVGLVAQRLSRRAVLIDLSADYLGQVMDRNRDIPLGLGA
jgi:DNA modification methylase